MPKRPKAYYRPKNTDEALKLLAKPGYVALAGGAHLLATEDDVDAEAAVDLQDAGLNDITLDSSTGALIVGATAKLVDLWEFLGDAALPSELPGLLRQAIRRVRPEHVSQCGHTRGHYRLETNRQRAIGSAACGRCDRGPSPAATGDGQSGSLSER